MGENFSAAQSLFDEGNYQASINILRQILSADITSINALMLISRCMLSSNRDNEASRYLEKALLIQPENHEAMVFLGEIFQKANDIESAKRYYEKALSINENNLQALLALADIESMLENKKKSIILLKQAAEIASNNANIWYKLANNYIEQRRLIEAEYCSMKANNLNQNLSEYHNQLGKIRYLKGDRYSAINSFEKALDIEPRFIPAKMWLNMFYSSSVPAWHIPMMNDLKRNNAYMEAINKAVKNDMVVLEIGTGSGLLSMMAVDAGASKVITCEVETTIAQVAEKVIFENGFSDDIKVVNKKSTELVIGKDMPTKADLVLSEILSSEFVGEGIIPTITDANTRLIRKNGKMIPESGEILISLLPNSLKAREDILVENMCGYDLSDFNSLTQTKISRILKEEPSFSSSIETAFTFNFYDKGTLAEQERIFDIEVFKNSTYLGFITWLKLNLYENISFENKPSKLGSGWVNPVYLFEKPLSASAGQKVRVKANLKRDSAWFEFIELL